MTVCNVDLDAAQDSDFSVRQVLLHIDDVQQEVSDVLVEHCRDFGHGLRSICYALLVLPDELLDVLHLGI
jgi:hypothetical protein